MCIYAKTYFLLSVYKCLVTLGALKMIIRNKPEQTVYFIKSKIFIILNSNILAMMHAYKHRFGYLKSKQYTYMYTTFYIALYRTDRKTGTAIFAFIRQPTLEHTLGQTC